MTWDRGQFRVDFTSSPREARIRGGTQTALMEAMRRVDELVRMAQELPLESQLAVDVARLEATLGDIPDELNGVLRHFDGVRTLRAAMDLSPVDDVTTMETVQRLLRDGILRPASGSSSLEAWVSAPPAVATVEPALPRIVNFPAIRGLRRERLRREAQEARMKIASGEPVRLHHVVELPPRGDSEALGELRRISPAAGEAAKRFAVDARLARLAPLDGGAELPPIAPVAATTPPPATARLVMRFARQRWALLAGLVALASTLGWVLRPQPHTDRKDSPWLEGTRDSARAAAAASGTTESAAYAQAVALGNDSFRQGKFNAAADQYKKALALRPQAVPVLVALADAYLESDRPRSAVEPLEAAARLDPANARVHLLLGTAYHSLGRTADATRAYRRFLELEPASEFAKDVKVILANLGG